MSQPLSDHERVTTLRVSRAMYPHDALPNEAYEKVVRRIDADARGNDDLRATIEQGIAELDDPTPFSELDAAARLAALQRAEGSPYFELVRATTVVLDQFDQPVPNVHFDDHPNDLAMREHAWSAGQALYESVGAVRTIRTPPYPATHNIGTARMSESPEDGVVNKFGEAHDVPNLFVSDASQFTTGAA